MQQIKKSKIGFDCKLILAIDFPQFTDLVNNLVCELLIDFKRERFMSVESESLRFQTHNITNFTDTKHVFDHVALNSNPKL